MKENILNEIKEWVEQNRNQLPLNVDSWHLTVTKDPTTTVEPNKEEADIDPIIAAPFYKPYSKMITL